MGLDVENLGKAVECEFSPRNKGECYKICQDCKLEISGILLTVNLKVMDMSEFKVIIGMDWLRTHRVIIDCDRIELPPAHMMVLVLYFRGDKHDVLPQAVYDLRWHGQLMSWLASLTLEDKVRQGLSLPRVVCKYKDVFSDELPGLPL